MLCAVCCVLCVCVLCAVCCVLCAVCCVRAVYQLDLSVPRLGGVDLARGFGSSSAVAVADAMVSPENRVQACMLVLLPVKSQRDGLGNRLRETDRCGE